MGARPPLLPPRPLVRNNIDKVEINPCDESNLDIIKMVIVNVLEKIIRAWRKWRSKDE